MYNIKNTKILYEENEHTIKRGITSAISEHDRISSILKAIDKTNNTKINSRESAYIIQESNKSNIVLIMN